MGSEVGISVGVVGAGVVGAGVGPGEDGTGVGGLEGTGVASVGSRVGDRVAFVYCVRLVGEAVVG